MFKVNTFLFILYSLAFSDFTWSLVNPSPSIEQYNDICFFIDSIKIIVGNKGTIVKSTDDGSTWSLIEAGTRVNLNSIDFCGNEKIFIAGDSGTLLFSSDFGDTWEKVPLGVENNLSQILFVNSSQGFITGSRGLVLKTTDKGLSWHTKSGFLDIPASDILYIADSIFIIIGDNGRIARSEKDITTWENVQSGTNALLHDITILSDSTIYAVGNNGTIISSNDLGRTWNDIASSTNIDLFSITFNSSGVGIISGNGYEILRSTDMGLNWEEVYLDSSLMSSQVKFINDSTCFITAGISQGQYYAGIMFKSTDSGKTWIEVKSNWRGTLYDIAYINPNLIIVSGRYGYMGKSEDGGDSWQEIQNSGMYQSNIGPMLRYDSLNIAMLCQYDYGSILSKTADGGLNWETDTNKIAVSYSVATLVPDLGLVGFGFHGCIASSADTGKNWNYYSLPANVMRMDFLDSLNGKIVNGRMLFSTGDGGEKWRLEFDARDTIYDVTYAGQGTVFATTNFKALLRSDNAGDTWYVDSQFTAPWNAGSIDFVSRNRGMFLSEYGCQYRTKNGGQTWVYGDGFGGEKSVLEYSVKFEDSTSVYIVGRMGIIVGSDNTGETWTDLTYFTRNGILDIALIDSNRAIICTNDRNILYYTENLFKTSTKVQTAIHFKDLAFPEPTAGYACCDSGVIVKSVDYGKTWETVHKDTAVTWDAIDFYNGTTGITTGFGHSHHDIVFLVTRDGGLSWNRSDINDSGVTREICFFDSLNWFISCYNPMSSDQESFHFQSSDAGQTWNYYQSEFFVRGISAVNSLRGFATGSNGIYKTSDAGKSWVSIDKRAGNGIYFLDGNTGMVFYDDNWNKKNQVGKTFNGGTTWEDDMLYSSLEIPRANGNQKIVFNENGYGLLNTYQGILVGVQYDGITKNKFNTVNRIHKRVKLSITNNFLKLYLTVNEPERVTVRMYDLKGRTIKTLIKNKMLYKTLSQGFQLNNISSGLYFVQISVGESKSFNKIVIK